MCAIFGCGPTVVSEKKEGVQTDRQRKLQLYIVDCGIEQVKLWCVVRSICVVFGV